MKTKAHVSSRESQQRNYAAVSLGDRVSAWIVLFALAYFGAQAVRVGAVVLTVILGNAIFGVVWQLLVWRTARGPR